MAFGAVLSRITRRSKQEKGQAAIELLLVFPVFFMFILLVVEFGLIMYSYVSVANGVREGARYGAVGCASSTGCGNSGACSDAVKTKAVDASGGILECADITVTWYDDATAGGTRSKNDSVKVDVANHTYNLLFFPGLTFQVKSCSVMRIEADSAGAASGSTVAPC